MFLILTYLMLFRYTRMEISRNWMYDDVLLKKSNLSEMASVKTNKKQTPLPKTKFSWQESLSLVPKRLLHSKGPKNAICLWLSHDQEHCWLNVQCSLSWLSQRQIAVLGPLEWRYHFGPKSKVSCHQKLVFRRAVRSLF